MNGFTMAAILFSMILMIFAWVIGIIYTIELFEDTFNYSGAKAVAIGVSVYLSVTIIILFLIGVCV